MSRSGIEAVADALIEARRSGMPADAAPLAEALADADEAYAAQQRVAEALGWFVAGVPRHWKSGGPGRTQPLTHAPLPPAGVWASPADASRWPMHTRLVESEIALRLGRDVDAALAATLDLARASALVDAMAVAIEIVDSRWQQGLAAPALLRLADLASHAALVLGDWLRHATARHGTLPASTVVTTGTWAGAPAAAIGDRVWLCFDGIGEAQARF